MPPTIFKNPKVEFENNMRKKYASPPTIVLISTGPCDFCNQGELHPLNIAKKSLWSAGECHPINFCNHPPPWVFIIYTVFSSVCGLNLHHHWSPPSQSFVNNAELSFLERNESCGWILWPQHAFLQNDPFWGLLLKQKRVHKELCNNHSHSYAIRGRKFGRCTVVEKQHSHIFYYIRIICKEIQLSSQSFPAVTSWQGAKWRLEHCLFTFPLAGRNLTMGKGWFITAWNYSNAIIYMKEK